MELARIGEDVYQLELQAYQTTFLDFKYEPTSFVYVEIKTSTRTTSASFTFGPNPREQPVITKLISPIRGGTCLEIIPLLVIILTIPVEVILELVVTLSLVVSSGLESLEFLFTTILLTPPQIGVGLEINFQYISCMR
jgi:hypothetical protein